MVSFPSVLLRDPHRVLLHHLVNVKTSILDAACPHQLTPETVEYSAMWRHTGVANLPSRIVQPKERRHNVQALKNLWRPPKPTVVHFLSSGCPASFALDHSPCARMIWIFNDISDSETVPESISPSSTINLSVCCANKPGGCSLTDLPVLTSINSSYFHSLEDQFLSTFHSE